MFLHNCFMSMIQDLYTLRKRHRIWQKKVALTKILKKEKKIKLHPLLPPVKIQPRQVVTSAGFQFAHIRQKAVKHWQLNSPKIPSALCIFHLQTIPTANQILCVLRSNYPASYRAEGWTGLFQQLHFWKSRQIKHDEKNQTRQTLNLPLLFPRYTQVHYIPLY